MTIDELAASLQVSFRAPIAEADEWRPLAQYIVQLLEAQREACAQSAAKSPVFDVSNADEARGRSAATLSVLSTQLVTESKP